MRERDGANRLRLALTLDSMSIALMLQAVLSRSGMLAASSPLVGSMLLSGAAFKYSRFSSFSFNCFSSEP
jgi:hypothetical protein